MSPELQQAVTERIALGHTQQQIASELAEAGYDQQSIEAIYATVSASAASTTSTLPRSRELIATAWGSMTGRFDLVLWLAVPSVVIGVIEYLNNFTAVTSTAPVLIALAVSVFALVILAILIQVAVIHAALTQTNGTTTPFADSLAWARRNFFGWLWLVVLSGLVVLGGWMLLVIPGVIAAVYIAFSQYVFVDENTKGLAALQRSRQLVYGKFASVLWRLFVMMVFLVALYIPIAVVGAIILGTATEGIAVLVVSVLEGFVSGIVGVLVAYYMANLYRSLKSMPTNPVQPTAWYQAYAGIGVLLFIALITIPILFATAIQEFGASLDSELSEPTQFQQEQAERNTQMQAELEAFQQQFQAEFEAGS